MDEHAPASGTAPQEIRSVAELEALYGAPLERSLLKEVDHLPACYRPFIEKSPFVILSTVGPKGLDSSPRGDPAGFVRIVDERTLLIPDRRGNNRTDTLHNLVHDPRIALLFLVPGIGETLRVSGSARILIDSALNESFAVQGKPACCVIEVRVARAYYQCQKALVRSGLWTEGAKIPRSELPSAGELAEYFTHGGVDAAEYDREYPERMKKSLY
jgi:PPOX class probable FMN-dependent enzyme